MSNNTREPGNEGIARTLGYDERVAPAMAVKSLADPALGATIAATEGLKESVVTMATMAESAVSAAPRRPGTTTMMARSMTVLPRVAGVAGPAPQEKPRYQASKVLGEGGMGEVVLADDQDIDRRVAIKRLRSDVATMAPAVLRFADEVRTVGALQHPNIVPVYDVGLDAEGQHYFVMKYLEGETLEAVLEKLQRGERAYVEKYTHAYRVGICIEVLRALEYAHAHGVLHRDLKPANIMIGEHGEVTLTDWGIAKKIKPRPVAEPVCAVGRPDAPVLQFGPSVIVPALLGLRTIPKGGKDAPRVAGAEEVSKETVDASAEKDSPKATGTEARPHATRVGQLLGTPMYMSPEQAAGKNDELDERSDLFSASVLFGELLSLRHYLADRTTMLDVLDGVRNEDFYLRYGSELGLSGVPAEMFHVVLKGMWREPEKRWQSAREMAAAFERTLSGDIWVCCPFTLTRRTTFLLTRWMNDHARLVTALVVLFPVTLLFLLVSVLVLALR